MSKVALILLLPLCCDAVRHKRYNSSGSVGTVSSVYTFGAPHVSNPALKKKDGTCFKGWRFINYQTDFWMNNEDIVPTLLVTSKYDHPHQKTLRLDDSKKNGIKGYYDCGKNDFRITHPDISLHMKEVYNKRMRKLGNNEAYSKKVSRVGLMNSYEPNVNLVKKNIQPDGYRLVAQATEGKDHVNLMQDTEDLSCIITFEGSDNFDDWKSNAAILRVSFCGLPMSVHHGFRNELRRIVDTKAFQNDVRPKLGKCSRVDATGHSLGGAVAMLFTTCVDWQNGSDDYNKMSWTQEDAVSMSSI